MIGPNDPMCPPHPRRSRQRPASSLHKGPLSVDHDWPELASPTPSHIHNKNSKVHSFIKQETTTTWKCKLFFLLIACSNSLLMDLSIRVHVVGMIPMFLFSLFLYLVACLSSPKYKFLLQAHESQIKYLVYILPSTFFQYDSNIIYTHILISSILYPIDVKLTSRLGSYKTEIIHKII